MKNRHTSFSAFNRIIRLTALAMAFSITGCITGDFPERAAKRDAELDAIRSKADTAATLPKPADPPAHRKQPDRSKQISETPDEALPAIPVQHFDPGPDADVGVVLRTLARGAEINLALGSGVTGPVRINIPHETSWDRLFKLIIETHGLHYEFKDGMLRVMSQTDVEKQSQLERALKERELARSERRRAEPLELALFRVRYAKPERLAESIRTALTAGPQQEETTGFSIIPDADSGLLVLRAVPKQLREILDLAQNLDQPAYQILLEATIVQTTNETARQLGVQWGALHNAPDGGKVSVGTTANPDGFNSNFPAEFNPSQTGFTLGIERLSGHQTLQAQLSALQREGRLSIISSPSITTLDKQKAIIESGEERPFQSAAGSGASVTPTVEFKEALLTLEVTPQVIDGNWIKLDIHTTKDDFDDTRSVMIRDSLQVPITTRRATTTLYLTNGETTVIGGLSTDSELDQEEGIPVLKNIPLFGALFRNNNLRNTFTDTVIFITPRILPDHLPGDGSFPKEGE